MKRKTLLFMMLMAMFSPLALNAQGTFGTFTTGEDVSRWITLDDPQTAMSSGQDDVASDLLTMGSDFSFPFGNGLYTQFWVNSNGMFSFSTNPAENERLWYNSRFPKICGISADLSTGNSGYIKYQLTGTAPNRVFVCEFVMDPKQLQSSYSDVRWQIQLHEAGSKVVIIYGTAPYSNPQSYQSGLSLSANDFWLLDPQTYAATHYTSIPEGRSMGWHGRCRYYEFTPPACYNSPTSLAIVENSLTTHGVTMQWDAEVGDVFDYAIELGTDIDPQTVTYAGSITATATTCSMTWDDLIPDNDYTVFIRRNCGDYGQPATMTIHTEIACFAPSNLTATANGRTATVAWEGDADSYEIAWSVDSNADPDQNIDPDFQISGTTGSKEFTTIDTRYYFWVRANCGDEGYSNWEGPVNTYIGYCRPNCWSMDGNGITNLVYTGTNTVTNTTHPHAYPFYGYYIDQICEIKTDETATLDITYQTNWGYKTYIWVDLDNSLSFEDSEILYTGESENSWSSTLNASITLPPTTAPGDYRMRIGGADDGMNNGGIPCYNNSHAVFEDYTLRVIEVTCPRPTDLTTTNLTTNSTTLNWESDAESFEVQYRVPYAEWNFFEGFENGLPSNWSTINGDQANDWWLTLNSASYAHSGSGCMFSNSGYDPDEWLISPQVQLHGTLKFYASNGGFQQGSEHFAVYVSTKSRAIQDFVMVGDERIIDNAQGYNEITIDINQYHGAMGYVAIRHFNSSGSMLILDDFSISYLQEEVPWIDATSETNSLNITNLTPNTKYEFHVKAECDDDDISDWSSSAFFTTPDSYSAPYYLTADATSNTAELSWTGYTDTYNVRYRHIVNDPDALVTVILTAGEPFYEGAGGFHMLLDANADAIGQFDLFTMEYEDWFEYTIPEGAWNAWGCGINVSNRSVSIQIPAGTYDWYITNPNPKYKKVYYIGDEGNVGNRQDNYVFEAGKVYEFEVKQYGSLSGADVTITEQTSAWTLVENVTNPLMLMDLIADTRYQFQVQGVNCDGNGNNTEWSETGTFTTTPMEYPLYILGYEDYDDPNGGYFLIASPVTVDPADAIDSYTQQSMIDGEFDLYYFDQTGGTNGKEWKNWKNEGGDGYHFNLEPGKGYLYAHKTDGFFTVIGTPYSGNGVIELDYDNNADLAGCNLLGNPYNYQVSVDKAFYVMNEQGTEIISADENTPIMPMQGFFVVATEAGQKVTFSEWHAPYAPLDKLAMNLSNSHGATIDRAIVRFDEGRQLPKFQLNKNHTKVFIPQEGKDYAIVNASEMGEMPVSFKAENNGTYTLSFSNENVEFGYLHLIDNMTGTDVDLLANPSYSFEAKTYDYTSRFKLVFATGNASDDNFAFFSNGELVINNEGNATLQVVDVMGRILKSESINGSVSKTINATPGVYMLRLINGENVKVQKVVIE